MKSVTKISPTDLNNLINVLDVKVVALSECLVSPGYNLIMGGHECPGLHYVLEGSGLMYLRNEPPIKVDPHTLIIVPPNCPFKLEVFSNDAMSTLTTAILGRDNVQLVDSVHRYTAGDGGSKTVLICGFFKTLYGSTMDLFEALAAPIGYFGRT